MKKIVLSKKVLVNLLIAETLLLAGLFVYWMVKPPAYVVDAQTGCRIYNDSHIKNEVERTATTSESAFGASDLQRCTRKSEGSIDIEPWAEPLLLKMNQSSDLEYDTFEEMIADRRYSEDKYVVQQNTTILPLYSNDAVIWICSEDVTCKWTPETLGHSTILYYQNGAPKVSDSSSTF